MTAEFGPLDDEHERRNGLPDTLGGLALNTTLASLELVNNNEAAAKYTSGRTGCRCMANGTTPDDPSMVA
jgi:hypothetical protein